MEGGGKEEVFFFDFRRRPIKRKSEAGGEEERKGNFKGRRIMAEERGGLFGVAEFGEDVVAEVDAGGGIDDALR